MYNTIGVMQHVVRVCLQHTRRVYFTARRYVSTVYAVVVRLCVYVCLSVCHTLILYQNG